MKKDFTFSEERIKKINKEALAHKYEVSSAYIGQVLRGEKGKNRKAKSIRQDANALLRILENPILNIEVVDPQIVMA